MGIGQGQVTSQVKLQEMRVRPGAPTQGVAVPGAMTSCDAADILPCNFYLRHLECLSHHLAGVGGQEEQGLAAAGACAGVQGYVCGHQGPGAWVVQPDLHSQVLGSGTIGEIRIIGCSAA